MISWRLHLMAARGRVPSPRPRFSRYHYRNVWHVCPYEQHLPFDSSEWIEVTW